MISRLPAPPVDPPPNGNPRTRRRAHLIDPVRKSTGIKASMGISCIATVCMGDLIHEAREFLPSARVAFPRVPIHVHTDNEAGIKGLCEDLNISDLHFHHCQESDHDFSSVKSHSSYWQQFPILCKLLAMKKHVSGLPKGSVDGVLLVD